MQIPYISRELLTFLEEIYPLRMPTVDETEREIFVRVGHREVIRTLKKFHDEQVANSMEGRLYKNVHV